MGGVTLLIIAHKILKKRLQAKSFIVKSNTTEREMMCELRGVLQGDQMELQ
jgi:hypothetical protein